MAEFSETDWTALRNKLLRYAAESAESAAAAATTTGTPNQSSTCDEKALQASGIYARYRNTTFESIEERGVPAEIRLQFDVVKQYANNLERHLQEGTGLLLRGPVGTLKTSLAVAVLQRCVQQKRHAQFLTMPSLLDSIFSAKAVSPEDWRRFEERLRQVPLLVLDDLGAEWSGGWVMTKVDAIFSERYNRQRATIVTTNLGSAELQDRYADRIIDRLRSTCQVITFNTPRSLRENCRPLSPDET